MSDPNSNRTDDQLPERRDRVSEGMRRRGWPKEGTPEFFEKLREEYGDNKGRAAARLTTAGAFAMAWKYLYDKTDKEVCEKFGFSKSKWRRLKNSPEGKELQEMYTENIHPLDALETLWRAESYNLTLELPVLYEKQMGVGDYKGAFRTLDKMLDIAEVTDMGREGKGGGGVTINLNVTRDQLESPEVETDYEVIETEVEDD